MSSFERKVYYLGTWNRNVVDNPAITAINLEIQKEKGAKVKLQVCHDGLRIVRNSVIQGKQLQDFISISRIQFLTVSQRMPNLLVVVALSADPGYRFVLQAFRCQNSIDSAGFLNALREIQKQIKPVTVVKVPRVAKEDEINWTLRSKEVDNSKRELKQFVNLHGEGVVVHKTDAEKEADKKELFQNGHSEVYENGVRIPIYRKGKPQRYEEHFHDKDTSDTRSEVSESALRSELESLSHELREIKLMLEKSTGIPSGSTLTSTQSTPRDFEPVNVTVHKHAVRSDTVIVENQTNGNERLDAVVLDDEVQMRPKQNGHIGYNVTTSGNATHVRVSVPDYRTPTDRVSISEEHETNGSSSTRSSMTSYENWKRNTMERNAVRYDDLPERIQWRSRTNKPAYVVTRPRSALPSWSSDVPDGSMVEVRHHKVPMVAAPHYQRVTFTPREKGQKSQSLRVKGMGSTVIKPIEKVYTGRGGSVRPHSAHLRGSILVDERSLSGSQVIYVENNNNIVKADPNDDLNLSVNDLELYSETPSGGAVIHT